MPIITLKAISDVKLGAHAAKEIMGTKMDGTAWKKAFFANNKELRDKLSDFEVGDIMDVVLTKTTNNGKEYYNITDFKEVSDDDIDKARSAPPAKAAEGQRAGGFRPSPNGGTRGDDTNRSAAIYLARECIVMACKDTVQPEHIPAEYYAAWATKIANDIILPYIKDGTVYKYDTPTIEKKTKKVKADPLAPPNLDE